MRADPAAPWWTYDDLVVEFGMCRKRIVRDMPEWRRRGFPQPLPWSVRQCRWRPDAVRRWKALQEERAGAAVRERPRLAAIG